MQNLIKHTLKQDNYTILANTNITNSALSLRARGLLALLLSLPSDWKVRKTWLYKQSKLEGRDAINRAWQELKKHGYIEQQKILDNKTKRIIDHQFIINEMPKIKPSEPTTLLENQGTASQTPDNGPLQRTNIKKTKTTNTEKITKSGDEKYIYWQTQLETALNHAFNNFEKRELVHMLTTGKYTDEQLAFATNVAGLAHAKSLNYVTQVLQNTSKAMQRPTQFVDIPLENIFI